jgi:hypothetical protein
VAGQAVATLLSDLNSATSALPSNDDIAHTLAALQGAFTAMQQELKDTLNAGEEASFQLMLSVVNGTAGARLRQKLLQDNPQLAGSFPMGLDDPVGPLGQIAMQSARSVADASADLLAAVRQMQGSWEGTPLDYKAMLGVPENATASQLQKAVEQLLPNSLPPGLQQATDAVVAAVEGGSGSGDEQVTLLEVATLYRV